MTDLQIIKITSNIIKAKFAEYRKKFELLLQSTNDNSKKIEYNKILKKIAEDNMKLEEGTITFEDLKSYGLKKEDLLKAMEDLGLDTLYAEAEKENQPDKNEGYRILKIIKVEPLNKYCDNKEINAIWSYLNFFSKEYLGLLSEQNMKLDYAKSFQRDSFFNKYNNVIRSLTDYADILEQMNSAANVNNKEYLERLNKLEAKQYRETIIKTSNFLKELKEFVNSLLTPNEEGRIGLLEPNKIVNIKGENSSINGETVKEAVNDLNTFVDEFLDFIKAPDLVKILNSSL